MHLLSTRQAGFVEDERVTIRLDQTPAEIVVLSAVDSTLALLARAWQQLEARGQVAPPALRLANLLHLRQPASLDRYIDEVLNQARLIVVDHLGAESAWAYGVQRLAELAHERQQTLVMFSGDLHEDEALLRRGTATITWSRELWRYLRSGGLSNAESFLLSLVDGLPVTQAPQSLSTPRLPPPRPQPPVALRAPWAEANQARATASPGAADVVDIATVQARWQAGAPVVALVFYRSHLQAGNTAAFDALALALHQHGLNPLPIAVDSLKSPDSAAAVAALCQQHAVALVLNTTAFAASHGRPDDVPLAGDAPVLQVIVCGLSREAWADDPHGLRPRDIAMQVALPEIDGRIITRAISFKTLARRCELTQTDLNDYQPDPERVAFVAELAWRWCRLRQLPAADKRLALILANYPGSEARIGSGVGLDTPAAVIRLLQLLRDEGYQLGETIPTDSDALMQTLCEGIANDPAQWPLRPAHQSLTLQAYRAGLAELPAALGEAIDRQWGPPEQDPMVRSGRFMIAGLRLGRVFIGIQPARAYGAADDGSSGNGSAANGSASYAAYHDAERVPPHGYVAFYLWLRQQFRIDAIVHVGKHGNLEWLPGKSVALSAQCWPDALLGPLPHLYPFIVNDPGEGAQAKRRTQAVIIDHLMPPLTRAETWGPLQDLERDVDEYYAAVLVDERRATLLRRQILKQIRDHRLDLELDLATGTDTDDDSLLARVDAWLCELKESQIRDGLHVFGESPRGQQRRDTLLALARLPFASASPGSNGGGSEAGLTQALARDLLPGDSFDPLDPDAARPWDGARPAILQAVDASPWRHAGDTRERLERLAQQLIEALVPETDRSCVATLPPSPAPPSLLALLDMSALPQTAAVLSRIRDDLAPRLDACGAEELRHFSRGLQGRFVPPGPSGSPSRGRPDVLPTGRNFYTVDTRAVPTQAAWTLGVKAAELLLETHLQGHGDYPQAIGLSVWGTATMRTGGDDIAQAFALLGVRPCWAAGSHRVIDVEVLPIVKLGRPRIDVTLRVSGFFRDAFTNVIQLFDAAVQAVVDQDDEPAEVNPIRARVLAEQRQLSSTGLDETSARREASWRVFGNAPGQYGTGLQWLLDHGQWQDDADLAEAWTASSTWAFGRSGEGGDGGPAPGALRRRLAEIDAVLQNQDSREHDLLDSGDYLQFQGGMTAAVRHESGTQPALYHGDHGLPESPRLRSLKTELARVIRARVVNPKWLAGVRRHGYKGAAEMAATVDYLYGFDATTGVIDDHQYALVADSYLIDESNRQFIETHNPQALLDIAARLLEAMDRGLWQSPGDYRERLEQLLLQQEARQEAAQTDAAAASNPHSRSP